MFTILILLRLEQKTKLINEYNVYQVAYKFDNEIIIKFQFFKSYFYYEIT